MSIRSKSNKQSDEESSLGIDHPNYGSVQRPASHLSSSSTASSDESGSLKANSDADEPSRATRRKKFRIQQRHSPHQISRLSSVIPGSNSNEASTSDLVLPALDPKAQEVIEAVTLSGPLEQLFMRRSNINLSTVRQKYRKSRKLVRDEKTEVLSIIQNIQLCIKQCFNYNTYISAIKDFLLANQTIVLFVCLARFNGGSNVLYGISCRDEARIRYQSGSLLALQMEIL
ncbi:hypothetical protein PHYBLDRAFT_69549 [Phycomyces blakesleeanus NRRL 1555(-)]|uniref:Uncharacterized protein n=1 Tax=Phycomyces blakesleeanus (strain ATCC 8743b / DSM 1359 / FGSC 10004 / NBRC 33097 / NRRL 1555) TaxID=763407 RepID=A0A162WRW9_PHYB8|nr:hypothetical protein PHYBLDRAFT_69549 [Phycomyces blakesleeanus NRRL 1555(-)]OAD70615.1 hypothetical protein PHYBLDRAFT_69549 [Phycomyces blakesleeanus NRRL 1555(-)]|eukprot:XP_018288655.1 hypothetical protein PHYBLDRAFT_69549 [Phycomyces blakesleeanus NRRL 1555(-)]